MPAFSDKTLANKTATASFSFVVASALAKAVDFVTLVVLTRVLTPSDFGLVAMAMTFILLVETIFDVPIGAGIVRAPVASKPLCHTAFTLALCRGLIIAGLLAAISFPVAVLYDDQRLIALLTVLSIAPVMRGLVSPRVFLLHRRLDFRLTSMAFFVGKFVALVLGVGVALATKSYWSIAIVSLAGPVVTTVLTYVYAPYSPRFTFKHFSRFKDILGWSTLEHIFSAINWQSDRIVLGAFIPPSLFGKYAMSANLASMPVQVLLSPIMQTVSASFAKVKAEDRLVSAYLKSSHGVTLILAPILLTGVFFAEPIIVLLFTEKWTEAVMPFQWLCLIQLIAVPTNPVGGVAMVLEKLHRIAIIGGIELILRLTLLILAVESFGIVGVLWAAGIVVTAKSALLSLTAKRVLHCPLWHQIRIHKRTVLSCAVFCGAALATKSLLVFDNPLFLLLTLSFCVGLSFTVYAITTLVLWILDGEPDGIETTLVQVTSSIYQKAAKVF